VRNIEAANVLARHDEILVSAAWANARNVFDAATRILWLLTPSDRFESEARWIALLNEYERFHKRMAALDDLPSGEAKRHLVVARQIGDFRDGVVAALPAQYKVPTRIPGGDILLRGLGVPGMYRLYIEGSQYMHAAMPATALYRKNLGDMKELGEYVGPIDWILPLRTCWVCLHNAGQFVVDRLGGTTDWPGDHTEIGMRIDAAFRALAKGA
jgi:hypothetical protein